jgi:hypothetical protein
MGTKVNLSIIGIWKKVKIRIRNQRIKTCKSYLIYIRKI